MRFLSWRHAGILRYNSVWQNLAALLFIVLSTQPLHTTFYLHVALFAVFSTLMTGYGYLINDLADRDLDRLHGKRNAFHATRPIIAIGVVGAMLIVGALFALPFFERSGFVLLWGVWCVTATAYSMPPLRLKERGAIGLAATIAAQQTLPTALLFAAFGDVWSVAALVFVLFSTMRGISSDAGHQVRDWADDQRTNTRTFAVRIGLNAIQKLYALSLELERLTLGAVLLLLLIELPAIDLPWLRVSIAWPLVLIYMLLLALTLGRSIQAQRRGQLAQYDPYDEERQARVRDALHVIHHSLPSVALPLYLAVWAAIAYWPNAVFALLLGALYGLYSPKRWAATWPLRPLLARLRST